MSEDRAPAKPRRSPGPPRDTSGRRDRTRRLIVETAIREFSERGYFAVSTRDIARRAGIATGLQYRYFPSKEALATACIEWGGRLWQEARHEHLAAHPTSTLAGYLVEHLVFVRRFLASDELGIYRFYKRHVNRDDFPALRLLDDVSTPEPDFDRELEAAFARGEIREGVTHELAQYLVDMAQNDLQETLYHRRGERDFGLTRADDAEFRRRLEQVVRTALAGILRAPVDEVMPTDNVSENGVT